VLFTRTVLQVLQPVVEPTFSARGFEGRRGRSPLDAVRHMQRRLLARSGWLLPFDVADFFDPVSHDLVLGAVSAKVTD
jgi:retron-type reverse transcriptase